MKTSEKYPLPTSAECHAKPASLVSVRDLAEFEMVYEAGVDIVDLKEPRSGALAPTDYETWSLVSGWFTCPVVEWRRDTESSAWKFIGISERMGFLCIFLDEEWTNAWNASLEISYC